MVSKQDVEQFLREFKEKMKLTRVFFRDDREGGVLCISFHVANKPINYPFKNQES